MDKSKLNDCMTALTWELQYIQNQLPNEKDAKRVKAMMAQMSLISQTNLKILSIMNNTKSYRENG